MASPGGRTTALVICSLTLSWNMSTISNALQTQKCGGWLPPPPLESLWCECNNTSNFQGLSSILVYPQVIETIRKPICSIGWIWKVLWETCLSEMIPPLTGCGQYPLAAIHRKMEWGKYPSAHLCLLLQHSFIYPFCRQKFLVVYEPRDLCQSH